MTYVQDATIINVLSRRQQDNGALRFIICGSAGSGKRPLTGWLHLVATKPEKCNISVNRPVAFKPYNEDRDIGTAIGTRWMDQAAARHDSANEKRCSF